MKPQKTKALRELTLPELNSRLRDTRESLFKLNFRKETKQLEDLVSVRIAKRDIAKMLTVIKEKNKTAPAAASKE